MPGPDVPYRTHLPSALSPQVSLPPPTSSGDADYPGLADTLAALRQAHPGATLRFVGDRPEAVRGTTPTPPLPLTLTPNPNP